MKHYTHLSKEERENIYKYLDEWLSQKEIALRIHRNAGTISRELSRNHSLISRSYNHLSWDEKQKRKKEIYHYLPDTAQKKSEERRRAVNWRSPLKNPEILAYTIEHMKKWWSPDIIAGTLKNIYPTDASMHISHECIYQFIYTKKWEEIPTGIYNPKGEEIFWLKHLLIRSHKRRKKQTGRSTRKIQKIPNRVDISQRSIDYPLCAVWEGTKNRVREEFGHFEWDSILSVRNTLSAIRTEVERKSRFLLVKRIPRKTADHTVQATISIYESLPFWCIKSITWDNGTEHTGHEEVTKALHVPIYFAEPYKSYQRWSNEHANGMIRRFFPKWTNFDEVSDEEIQKVVDYLNNRPRKILWYKTPKQVFDSYLTTFL